MLGTELVLASTAGPAVLGQFAVAHSLLLVLGMLSLVGSNLGIVRFVGTRLADNDQVGAARALISGWILTGMAGCVVGSILFGVAPWLAREVLNIPGASMALLWVAAAIPLEAVNQSSAAAFRGFRASTDHVLTQDFIRNALVFSCVVLSPTLRGDIGLLAALLFTGNLACTFYGLARSRPRLKGVPLSKSKPLLRTFRALLAFSWPLSLWNVLQVASGRLQIPIISAFLPAAGVGVFSLLLRSMMALTFIQSVVNHTMPVEFAALHHRGHEQRLRSLYRATGLSLLTIAITLSLPVIADSELILGWIGPAYKQDHALIIPLLAVQSLNVGAGPMGQLLVSAHERTVMLCIAGVTAFSGMAGLFLLVPVLGLAGAVIAECSTILIGVLLRQWIGWRRLGVVADLGTSVNLVTKAAVSIAATLGVQWILVRIADIQLSAIPGALLFWAALLLASPRNRRVVSERLLPRRRPSARILGESTSTPSIDQELPPVQKPESSQKQGPFRRPPS
jgi:O-antigen/teichoic acid export membrane protein